MCVCMCAWKSCYQSVIILSNATDITNINYTYRSTEQVKEEEEEEEERLYGRL